MLQPLLEQQPVRKPGQGVVQGNESEPISDRRHLLTRLDSFEVSGPVQRLTSIVNGSIKHLPLSYRTKESSTT